MNTPGFIPFGEVATASDEGRALLAEIQPSELDAANINALAVYGRAVAELDVLRLKRVVADVKYTRREREQRNAPGRCWQCGCEVAASGRECRPCHEGMTPTKYGRIIGQQFVSKPAPLPRWL